MFVGHGKDACRIGAQQEIRLQAIGQSHHGRESYNSSTTPYIVSRPGRQPVPRGSIAPQRADCHRRNPRSQPKWAVIHLGTQGYITLE